jgi:hypothetical protein
LGAFYVNEFGAQGNTAYQVDVLGSSGGEVVSGACGELSLGGSEFSILVDFDGPNPGNPSVDWECLLQNTSSNTIPVWYGGLCAYPTGDSGHKYGPAKLLSIKSERKLAQ